MLVLDRGDHALVHAMRRAKSKRCVHLIEFVNRARIGARKLDGFGDNGRQDGLEIQGRIDGLTHLVESTELTE